VTASVALSEKEDPTMTSPSMTNGTLLAILIALAAAAIVISAVVAARRRARQRSLELQRRFGPEYAQAVEDYGSPARAERELSKRARRVGSLKLAELSEGERERYTARWTRIQQQFVDDPIAAVAAANALINDVMRVRGYPVEDFDQRVADLSVDHASVTQHYRAARRLSASVASDRANTEDLRQAVVHYRALFADLLVEPAPPTSRRVAHA
jgi:hypothetical protein